jgi:hypothetical protein
MMDFRQTDCDDVDHSQLAQNRLQYWASVVAAIEFSCYMLLSCYIH